MNNEKGLTLIELLATLSIAAFFVGTIFLVLFQVNLEWNSQTNQYNGDTQARFTMETMTNQLADATSVAYYSSNGWIDLRFQTKHQNQDGTFETKVFHIENGKMTLYTFNPIDYLNPSPSQSDYSNGMVLATNVDTSSTHTPSYQVNGVVLTNANAKNPYSQGQTVTISIYFLYNNNTNGYGTTVSKPFTTSIKLLNFN